MPQSSLLCVYTVENTVISIKFLIVKSSIRRKKETSVIRKDFLKEVRYELFTVTVNLPLSAPGSEVSSGPG